jgi:mono/diheme cytochrome c family protein
MAATDQTYRNQRTLDIVFAVSCLLMLLSIIGMFVQDYNRSYKVEQRVFRDVEEAIADRQALQALPDPDRIAETEKEVAAAQESLDKGALNEATRAVNNQRPKMVRAEVAYQTIKADYDSAVSLYNIAVERHGPESTEAQNLRKRVGELEAQVQEKLAAFDQAKADFAEAQRREAEVKGSLTQALDKLKKANGDFDRIAKSAYQKRWGFGDALRRLPVIDGFASPYKIQQITLEDLPIDYSFKFVTRFDRCTTCHLGIDRPAYDKQTLAALAEVPQDLSDRLARARELIRERERTLQEANRRLNTNEKLGYDENALRLTAVNYGSDAEKQARINQYAAHPRLDLFVGENSAHPRQKVGCTACHGGQGSATDFTLASHTPTDVAQKERWTHELDWQHIHDWEYPMQPRRFLESGCLKCHHEVTGLIREGNKVEAPKLYEGYRLIEKAGCFGCHEIAGIKTINNTPRWVGPDLRLEPNPPLEARSPADRAQLTADPTNPPGGYRKVGPSLYRISEKTSPEWAVQWVRAPRDFRPTTWMPHFYGLSNNLPDVLPDDQKKFPDAEIHSIVYYLFERSKARDKSGEKPMLPADQLPPPAKGAKLQIERGRVLFSERGCLACHQHQGTTQAAGSTPAVAGRDHFGPDLSRVHLKLGTKRGDQASARHWLVQWLLDPTVHNPRTFMPNTQLTAQDADDIAAWLLNQPDDGWKGPDVPPPDVETLRNLARAYLGKRPRSEIDRLVTEGLNADELKGLAADAFERELAAPVTEDKLKLFVGRRAIAYLGCYACHNIPGFDNAKPIGTPLNDWGRKDPERLAFEDIQRYVDDHYRVVDARADAQDPTKPAAEWKVEGGKEPYEKFFYELLTAHQREGFLHQKLMEPRSYDYLRMRTWDERLRMPQFKFARVDRRADEDDAAYEARAHKEEAEGREAVMTFVLGLVAEPINAKFIYTPQAERLAEIKGRHVLDKYNCASCHQIRPGIYEFKSVPASGDLPATMELLDLACTNARNDKADYRFKDHSAWVGLPLPAADRFVARGVPNPVNDTPGVLILRPTEALRYTNADKQACDIPAGISVGIRRDSLTSTTEPYGGTFSELLVPFLQKLQPDQFKDYKSARVALPPPLYRLGEKLQPGWMFQFLLNPQPVRPQTVLRMPRFSMSEEEAMALVNYFAAVDRINNPAFGVNYPYIKIPQQDDGYWAAQTAQYLQRLRQTKLDGNRTLFDGKLEAMYPVWERMLEGRVSELEGRVADTQAIIKATKDDDTRKAAEKALADLQKELTELRDEAKQKNRQSAWFTRQRAQWEQRDAYALDAYRLMANAPCLSCHKIGNLPAQGQYPALDLTAERLRPEWTLRWIANPNRLLTYDSVMPQNFAANKIDPKTGFHELFPEFAGSPLEQATAVRDLLMRFGQIADLPANRYYRPGGEGAK